MSLPSYITDAMPENFPRLVLENSAKGPVLVHYWSPRAGPCLMLMPRLVQLATEFGGRFLLALLNTDDHGPLARSHGVMSVPTIKLFRNGQAIDTLHGAEPEEVLRRFIEKHLPDQALLTVLAAHARGDRAGAVREAVAIAARDSQPALELAKRLVLQEQHVEADALLRALPEAVRAQPDTRRLAMHVSFLLAARAAPAAAELDQRLAANPGDLEARFQRGALALVENDFESALDQLLEITRRDRRFRNDIGRHGLLVLFEMLGENDPLVLRCRSQLPP